MSCHTLRFMSCNTISQNEWKLPARVVCSLTVNRISSTHSVNGTMLCLSTSVDSCAPGYLSSLINTIGNSLFLEYEKCLLLESFPQVLLYEIQIQQQFLLHHYIFQFELLSRVYAQNKKEENFGRIEILPFCSKKRVCAKKP